MRHIGKFFFVIICFGVIYSSCKSTSKLPRLPEKDTIEVQDEYIITFTDDYVLEFNRNLERSYKDSMLEKIIVSEFFPAHRSDTVVNIKAVITYGFTVKTKDEKVIEILRSDRRVKSVKHNYLIPQKFGAFSDIRASFAQVVPDNISFVMTTVRANLTSTKRVFILDSGIDLGHDDLNVSKAESKSFITGETVDDLHGHGTHVAGIIGAKNNSTHVVGIAPNALIVAYKVSNKDGNLDFSAYTKGLDMVKTKGARGDVLNLSIEGGDHDDTEEKLIKDIASKGLFVVIAAGNKGKSIEGESIYPQNINEPKVYVIGSYALPAPPTYSSFSNYGTSVDYAAPGERILSTYKGNATAMIDGTSQATPHVSGLLYLLGTINNVNIMSDTHGRNDLKVAHE